MPIHAAKEHQAPDDERVALLSADEENQQQDTGSKAFKGNGLPSADHVKGSTKYGAVWQRATQTAIRNKHRFEISRKLQSFKVEDFEKHRKSDEEIKQIKDKKIKKYYQEQNRRLNDWLEVDAVVVAMAEKVLQSFEPQDLDHDGVAEAGGELQNNEEQISALLPQAERERRQKEARQERIAVNVNVGANVLLLIAKAVATIFSSSLSLLASLADSALDLLMTLIIFGTAKLVSWKSSKLSKRYPVGRRRLQPLGTLAFSIVMVLSFAQILEESVQRLLSKERHIATLPASAIGSMVGTIVLKGIIWFGCAFQPSSQVQALAQDCKTDVIFNTASLLFPAIGILAKLWWLDPLGAGLLSLYIMFDWGHTCLKHIDHLGGASVDETSLRKLMYLAWRFSPVVDAYKNIKAYHAGDGMWVECDLLLDPKTNLKEAHDVSELMQYCFEGLNEVDRAFVSVDYAEQGPTGHASTEAA